MGIYKGCGRLYLDYSFLYLTNCFRLEGSLWLMILILMCSAEVMIISILTQSGLFVMKGEERDLAFRPFYAIDRNELNRK